MCTKNIAISGVSLFSIDADIDECEVYNYNDYCNVYHEGFICNNLIGDYQCVCGPGYYFSHYYYECIRKKFCMTDKQALCVSAL